MEQCSAIFKTSKRASEPQQHHAVFIYLHLIFWFAFSINHFTPRQHNKNLYNKHFLLPPILIILDMPPQIISFVTWLAEITDQRESWRIWSTCMQSSIFSMSHQLQKLRGQQKSYTINKGQMGQNAHLISKEKVAFCRILRIVCDMTDKLQHRSYPCSKQSSQKTGLSFNPCKAAVSILLLSSLSLQWELSLHRATNLWIFNPCQMQRLGLFVITNFISSFKMRTKPQYMDLGLSSSAFSITSSNLILRTFS